MTYDGLAYLQELVAEYTSKTGLTGNISTDLWFRKKGENTKMSIEWSVWLANENNGPHAQVITEATMDECITWMEKKLNLTNESDTSPI